MRANPEFATEPVSFWAYVRTIGEAMGYSKRGADRVASFSVREMIDALVKLGRSSDLLGTSAAPTPFARKLRDYFNYRAEVLNTIVRHNLMDTAQVQAEYDNVKRQVGAVNRTPIIKNGKVVAFDYTVGRDTVRVPMNKQSGDKRAESYLTGMVNLLIAHSLDGRPCDYDPRKIPVIDYNGSLYAALSRRMDGAYPSTTNPIALWEIKEYYYTTTFGSRISDAVYITSLDGYERLEVQRETGITIEHLVMLDAYDTWWGKGKSYLCRLVDALHMGHVDEILFGREVTEQIPSIVSRWVATESEGALRDRI